VRTKPGGIALASGALWLVNAPGDTMSWHDPRDATGAFVQADRRRIRTAVPNGAESEEPLVRESCSHLGGVPTVPLWNLVGMLPRRGRAFGAVVGALQSFSRRGQPPEEAAQDQQAPLALRSSHRRAASAASDVPPSW